MFSFNVLPKISCRIALTATAICLCAGTQAVVAGGGGNFGDHGGMRGHESGERGEGMKTPEARHDRERGDDGSKYFSKPEDRHQNADERSAKIKGKDKDTAGTNTPSAPGIASSNTIHPIVTNNPAQPTANAPIATGKLPPNDPVGNTHPTVGSSTPTVVTVSNGVTTTQNQNGLGGVSVYSDKPGTITVTNGKESTTLTGASVTLSGNVAASAAVRVLKLVRVTERAKRLLLSNRPHRPRQCRDMPKPWDMALLTVPLPSEKGVYDATHPGFTAHPVNPTPPPATSTIQQQ